MGVTTHKIIDDAAKPPAIDSYITTHLSTSAELLFLKHLGKWSKCEVPRIVLLRRYQEAAGKRTDWGGIHRSRILAFVSSTLRYEEKKLEGKNEA